MPDGFITDSPPIGTTNGTSPDIPPEVMSFLTENLTVSYEALGVTLTPEQISREAEKIAIRGMDENSPFHNLSHFMLIARDFPARLAEYQANVENPIYDPDSTIKTQLEADLANAGYVYSNGNTFEAIDLANPLHTSPLGADVAAAFLGGIHHDDVHQSDIDIKILEEIGLIDRSYDDFKGEPIDRSSSKLKVTQLMFDVVKDPDLVSVKMQEMMDKANDIHDPVDRQRALDILNAIAEDGAINYFSAFTKAAEAPGVETNFEAVSSQKTINKLFDLGVNDPMVLNFVERVITGTHPFIGNDAPIKQFRSSMDNLLAADIITQDSYDEISKIIAEKEVKINAHFEAYGGEFLGDVETRDLAAKLIAVEASGIENADPKVKEIYEYYRDQMGADELKKFLTGDVESVYKNLVQARQEVYALPDMVTGLSGIEIPANERAAVLKVLADQSVAHATAGEDTKKFNGMGVDSFTIFIYETLKLNMENNWGWRSYLEMVRGISNAEHYNVADGVEISKNMAGGAHFLSDHATNSYQLMEGDSLISGNGHAVNNQIAGSDKWVQTAIMEDMRIASMVVLQSNGLGNVNQSDLVTIFADIERPTITLEDLPDSIRNRISGHFPDPSSSEARLFADQILHAINNLDDPVTVAFASLLASAPNIPIKVEGTDYKPAELFDEIIQGDVQSPHNIDISHTAIGAVIAEFNATTVAHTITRADIGPDGTLTTSSVGGGELTYAYAYGDDVAEMDGDPYNIPALEAVTHSTANVTTADVPLADVPLADVPTADVPTADAIAADVPASHGVSWNNVAGAVETTANLVDSGLALVQVGSAFYQASGDGQITSEEAFQIISPVAFSQGTARVFPYTMLPVSAAFTAYDVLSTHQMTENLELHGNISEADYQMKQFGIRTLRDGGGLTAAILIGGPIGAAVGALASGGGIIWGDHLQNSRENEGWYVSPSEWDTICALFERRMLDSTYNQYFSGWEGGIPEIAATQQEALMQQTMLELQLNTDRANLIPYPFFDEGEHPHHDQNFDNVALLGNYDEVLAETFELLGLSAEELDLTDIDNLSLLLDELPMLINRALNPSRDDALSEQLTDNLVALRAHAMAELEATAYDINFGDDSVSKEVRDQAYVESRTALYQFDIGIHAIQREYTVDMFQEATKEFVSEIGGGNWEYDGQESFLPATSPEGLHEQIPNMDQYLRVVANNPLMAMALVEQLAGNDELFNTMLEKLPAAQLAVFASSAACGTNVLTAEQRTALIDRLVDISDDVSESLVIPDWDSRVDVLNAITMQIANQGALGETINTENLDTIQTLTEDALRAIVDHFPLTSEDLESMTTNVSLLATLQQYGIVEFDEQGALRPSAMSRQLVSTRLERIIDPESDSLQYLVGEENPAVMFSSIISYFDEAKSGEAMIHGMDDMILEDLAIRPLDTGTRELLFAADVIEPIIEIGANNEPVITGWQWKPDMDFYEMDYKMAQMMSDMGDGSDLTALHEKLAVQYEEVFSTRDSGIVGSVESYNLLATQLNMELYETQEPELAHAYANNYVVMNTLSELDQEKVAVVDEVMEALSSTHYFDDRISNSEENRIFEDYGEDKYDEVADFLIDEGLVYHEDRLFGSDYLVNETLLEEYADNAVLDGNLTDEELESAIKNLRTDVLSSLDIKLEEAAPPTFASTPNSLPEAMGPDSVGR